MADTFKNGDVVELEQDGQVYVGIVCACPNDCLDINEEEMIWAKWIDNGQIQFAYTNDNETPIKKLTHIEESCG